MSLKSQPAATEAANILEKAATHLNRVGLNKGYLYDEAQARGTALESCRVCAIGAVLAAAYGKPRYPADELETLAGATDLAIEALETQVGAPPPVWNDEDDRTVDEVAAAMTAAAASLREAA